MAYRRYRESKELTYDNEVTLVNSADTDDTDDLLQPVYKEEYTNILCKEKSISRNEFYSAATNGLKPEKIITVHKYEYENQTQVIFENLYYDVIRAYSEDAEEIELILQRRVKHGAEESG